MFGSLRIPRFGGMAKIDKNNKTRDKPGARTRGAGRSMSSARCRRCSSTSPDAPRIFGGEIPLGEPQRERDCQVIAMCFMTFDDKYIA